MTHATTHTLTTFALAAFMLAACSSVKETQAPQSEETVSFADFDISAFPVVYDPDRALQHFITGSVHESKNEFEKARSEYLQALHFDDDPTILEALSRSFLHTGELKSALVTARRCVEIEPENIEFRENLGDLYVSLGALDSAAVQYEYVIGRAPANLQAK